MIFQQHLLPTGTFCNVFQQQLIIWPPKLFVGICWSSKLRFPTFFYFWFRCCKFSRLINFVGYMDYYKIIARKFPISIGSFNCMVILIINELRLWFVNMSLTNRHLMARKSTKPLGNKPIKLSCLYLV